MFNLIILILYAIKDFKFYPRIHISINWCNKICITQVFKIFFYLPDLFIHKTVFFFLFFFFFFFFFCFLDRVSLCSPGYPGTQSVDQAGLKLRNPPASASPVLGLKACATTAQQVTFILRDTIMSTFSLIFIWPGEIVHCLKALGALAEDFISVPSWLCMCVCVCVYIYYTHIYIHTHTYIYSFKQNTWT